ncbi:MAG: NYN domain-containing protein, partial [Actinobacteria bacterium]|nr:NYN domain-containing protein [Actinomycetota bacterium]
MDNVAVYIDGFNLYNGMKAKHGRKFLWLDLEAVSQRLLRPGQRLVAVRYFTASVRNDPPAQARQNAYI